MRTIAASPDNLTPMAAFGHRIAASPDRRTLNVYDSVTGVLGLSLGPVDLVWAITGSSDGSILFCADTTDSITAWDIQTGGLIHTFRLEQRIQDIAVSSKGRYLACRLYDGCVKVWDIADKTEVATWTRSRATHLCWLEPEEWLVVSTETLVNVWDVVTGTVRGNYKMDNSVRCVAYSQKSNQLAVAITSTPGSTITIINPQTVTPTASYRIPQQVHCFAFSQITEELVCGLETPGLWLSNVLAQHSKHIEYPRAMRSVSCLRNGTVVANFPNLGVQLLSPDLGHTPSHKPTISPLAIRPLDQGRIIAICLDDRIVLLGLATMSQLLSIRFRNLDGIPINGTTILCASQAGLMAVCHLEVGDKRFLQLWRFHEEVPRWTVEVDARPRIGRISPTAVRLVTFGTKDGQSRVDVWNTKYGQLDLLPEVFTPKDVPPEDVPPEYSSPKGSRLPRSSADFLLKKIQLPKEVQPSKAFQLPEGFPPEEFPSPLDIRFTSDAEFYLQYNERRISCTVRSRGLFTRGERTPPPSQSLDLDDTCEWVVSGSKRICGIAPGYIRLASSTNYCWAGSSLVMVGEDEILRRLDFCDSHEG